MLLAATWQRNNRIKSGAREQRLEELCRFLQEKRCADSSGRREHRITGVSVFKRREYTLMPDFRIVAGTYLLAAAATRGQICLHRVPLDHMKALLDLMRQTGVRLSAKKKKQAGRFR